MKDADQMCEQCLPDTKLKLVHEIDDHHLGNIERVPKSLEEGVLYHSSTNIAGQRQGKTLTTTGTEEVSLRMPSTPAPATA